MSDSVFRLDDVGYAYPGAASSFSLELESLRVRPGEILALVGPNGAGKTTLLMLLAFLARPGRGRLEFLDGDPWASEDSAVRARRDAVLATHHPYLFKGTVADNLSFGLKLRKVPEAERPERLRSALALVELEGWENKSISGLSAGQAQRVALARALSTEPRLLLGDEVTGNLDRATGREMLNLVRAQVAGRGLTAIVVTHDASVSDWADRALELQDGHLVA